MGAAYGQDSGHQYYAGGQGAYHLGPGLSQMVRDKNGNEIWVAKTKKGRKAFPYVPERHAKGVKKGIKFQDHSGKFKDKDGHFIYVSKKNPDRYYTHAEHLEYVKTRSGGKNRAQNAKGSQGQQQQNKKKKRKNGKVDSPLIKLIQSFKSHMDEPKSKGSPFPNIQTFKNPSLVDVATSFMALKKSFDNSTNDFVGKNPDKKWPEDLNEWNFPEAVGDLDANYKNFYRHASKLTRGIAKLIISNKNYKDSKSNVNNLAQSIAKANDLAGEKLNMETVVGMLAHKAFNLKLHNPQHIFAVLPKVAVSLHFGASGTKPREFLAQLEKKPQVVDDVTYRLLIANDLKLLKRILKRVKNIYKKMDEGEDEDEVSDSEHAPPPKASASSAADKKRLTGDYPDLVGMNGEHVY
jgi:hypothetical protein